jgi:hypothetical protein
MADIGDAKAATRAKTTAQEKRIVCEDVIWDLDKSEELVEGQLALYATNLCSLGRTYPSESLKYMM